MNIQVTKNKVILNPDYKLNQGEYKVNKCVFSFSEEYTNNLVLKAIFSDGTNVKEMPIIDNECHIPYEVLTSEMFTLGVYAYEVDEEELVLRYSPEPCRVYVNDGSYKEGATEGEEITPSQFEQYEQALNNGLNEVANVNIDAEQTENGASVTITNRQGVEKTVEILNGEKGDKGDKGDTGEKGDKGDKGDAGPAGAIKMLIVNQLPTTGEEGTLYFVPKQDTETSDIYDEYMWVNNNWERLGEKQIVVDLSDYYKKQEVNNLLDEKADVEDIPDLTDYVKNTDYATSSKGGVIKSSDSYKTSVDPGGTLRTQTVAYSTYQTMSNNAFIGKGTLENVITGKELVNKTYVDSLVGDIDTILETLTTGTGV